MPVFKVAYLVEAADIYAVPFCHLGQVIDIVTMAMTLDAGKAVPPDPKSEKLTAKQIKDAVQPDSIMCFEDGKRYKSMKRHLRVHFNLTPDEYRAKWGLPASFPMTAPDYSARRSELAKANGLGRK